jgi:hypothetical protein
MWWGGGGGGANALRFRASRLCDWRRQSPRHSHKWGRVLILQAICACKISTLNEDCTSVMRPSCIAKNHASGRSYWYNLFGFTRTVLDILRPFKKCCITIAIVSELAADDFVKAVRSPCVYSACAVRSPCV